MSVETLELFFRYNHSVVRINIKGLTHEDSLHQPSAGGNCLNWVLGHIVATRNSVLEILGEEAIWNGETAERYARGSAPVAGDAGAMRLETIVEDFNSSQQRIMKALSALDPRRLADPAPSGTTKNENETVGSLLAALAFHETYHTGQSGLLRRLVGKPGAIV
jgi:uncharacterized damage-inducible protein DinB